MDGNDSGILPNTISYIQKSAFSSTQQHTKRLWTFPVFSSLIKQLIFELKFARPYLPTFMTLCLQSTFTPVNDGTTSQHVRTNNSSDVSRLSTSLNLRRQTTKKTIRQTNKQTKSETENVLKLKLKICEKS
jgi:hypothetical protein